LHPKAPDLPPRHRIYPLRAHLCPPGPGFTPSGLTFSPWRPDLPPRALIYTPKALIYAPSLSFTPLRPHIYPQA